MQFKCIISTKEFWELHTYLRGRGVFRHAGLDPVSRIIRSWKNNGFRVKPGCCITLFGIIFGTFWLGPWVNGLGPISKVQGLSALADPSYLYNRHMVLYWGDFQLSTLVFALFLSVLKPWKGRIIMKAVGISSSGRKGSYSKITICSKY